MDVRSVQEKLSGVVLSQLERRIRECKNSTELAQLMVEVRDVHGTYTRHADGSIEFDPPPAPKIVITAKPKEEEAVRIPFAFHSENGWLVPNRSEEEK